MARLHWMKLKKDFFKRHNIQIIEHMNNGKDYVLFYLKMLCESLDHEGRLRFSDEIPYTDDMLSVITETNIDVVRSAMKLFESLRLVERLEDQTIYMCEVEKFIGSESDSAERVRRYRASKMGETSLSLQCNNDVTDCNEPVTQSIDIRDKSLDNRDKNVDLGLIKLKEKKIDMIARDYGRACRCEKFIPHEEFTLKAIDAIIIACQFESPRTYFCKQYTGEDFIKIFESLTTDEIMTVVGRIYPHRSQIKDLTNYVASVMAEIYGNRKNNIQGDTSK